MTSHLWRTQDGLPYQTIQAIAQTPDHYLWLGTHLGLVRFDGYHFLDYGSEEAPALHDFGVYCMVVAKDGSLWVGTEGGGVVHLFNGKGRTYSARDGLENELVRAVYEDEDGHIWAGADHGIYRLSGDQFHRMDGSRELPNLAVHAIVGDGSGGLWAAGSRLLHIRGPMWTEIHFPKQAASLRIRALARGRDGTLWVGTLGGLFQMEPTADVIQKTREIKGGVLSLRTDSRGRLWMGTLADGLFLRSADGTISRGGSPKELASNVVLSVMEDLSQDLWVGTPAGLTRFSETGMRLIRIPGAMDSEFGSVAVDTDRSLWVCSKNLMHVTNGSVQHTNLPSLGGVTARSVMRERSGAFWVGTMGSVAS